jgi:putative ABC transport system permease protein
MTFKALKGVYMLFWTIVKVALRSLVAHKLRSFLAMLGIIIGVGAVISMLALTAGAQKQVMSSISAMGTNLLIVRPGQRASHGVMSGIQQNLTVDDARAIVGADPGIARISPSVRGNAQLKYANKNSRTSIIGAAATYFEIRNLEVEKGRALTEDEVDRLARSAVIGPVTATNLFGESEAAGETIKLNGINFRVVGVLKSKGDQGFFNQDDQVIVPYTTAMKQLLGLDYLQEVDIEVTDTSVVTHVTDTLTALLRKRHRLQPGVDNDFDIRSQAEMLAAANSSMQTFTILLGGIASISLLVGGIGIMNIMLVTVTERTREIGVRKAIGAKDRDIRNQFLLEAMLMASLGGLIGVGFGIGGASLVQTFSPFPFKTAVTMQSIVLSLSFSAAVGIFFGYYPARRAAALDPIEALRYE